ncbi:hypothetical protein [Amycolatopsis sp. NPDC051716]|uniref:hypothetical protein n=1 Tax=Amycolatopsis sp. NPDC051716 TaxID=3155804 RepID=UPI00342C7C8E
MHVRIQAVCTRGRTGVFSVAEPAADLADRVGRVLRRSGELPPALPQPFVDLLVSRTVRCG